MRRGSSRKVVAGGCAVALVAGGAIASLSAAPAVAATVSDQSQSCVDGGGTRWHLRTTWGKVYTDSSGARRVQNNVVSLTTASPQVKKLDYIVWTYNPDGTRIQDLRRSNLRFDFRRGAARLTRDVRNPLSGPGKTKIKVKVGNGGDGKSKCSVVFTQPGTAATPPPPANPPAPTPNLNYDTVWTTGYTWWDNSPPGSAAISRPVIHKTAGGVGTYADPITLAVAYKNRTPIFPYGTRFYLPKYKKYFIVEDICGACDRVPSHVEYKIDLWLDARNLKREAARQCTYRNTGTTQAVKNPPRGLPVSTARIC